MQLKISDGNSKMGKIPSVSLPAGKTCRNDCECNQKCYAKKISRLRKTVREAYESNYTLLRDHSEIYWREVEAAIMMSRFFRFHVSGDIPDRDYLMNIINVASYNKHCEILCFTKKYDIVNDVLSSGVEFPSNLHIIMSAWRGLEMDNPYDLPEAHVRYKDGTTTARDNAVLCKGNCSDCAITESGCWTLSKGEQVVFNEH